MTVQPGNYSAEHIGPFEDLYFICIQAEAGTLSQATLEDGIRTATKTSWMKK